MWNISTIISNLKQPFYNGIARELQTRPVDALVDSMKNGQTSIVGQLTNEDLTAVLDASRNSNLFSAKEKRQYFY